MSGTREPAAFQGRVQALLRVDAGAAKLFLMAVVCLCLGLLISCGASGPKYSRDGYAWVPVQKTVTRPTEKQKEMIEMLGKPQATWRTPFGTVMWVYCQYGVPVRILIFGEKEMIKEGSPSSDRTDLCEEP